MDDMASGKPAKFFPKGWQEFAEYRSMVIYVRMDSRPLTPTERTQERVRQMDMAARVESLRLKKLNLQQGISMSDVPEGGNSRKPMQF